LLNDSFVLISAMKIAPPYRWDGDVDGTWFLRQRVGGILRHAKFLLKDPFSHVLAPLVQRVLDSDLDTTDSTEPE